MSKTEKTFSGYLTSLAVSHSNKKFKAKQIQDDLIFSSVESTITV